MRCKYLKQKLDRYIQGDLPEPISEKIERHLHKCHDCADVLSRIKKLNELFEDISSTPVPDGFSERLMQLARQKQYLQQEREPAVIRLWEWFDRTGLKKSTAAAVLIVGLAIGMLMGRDNWQSSDVQSVGKSQMVQIEPTAIYKLDYLTDTPRGSLADVYLTLMSTTIGRER
jgi:anti-sigma factor RsiW